MKKKILEYITESIEILQQAQLKIKSSEGKKLIILDEKFMNEINISEDIDEFRTLKDIKNMFYIGLNLHPQIIIQL